METPANIDELVKNANCKHDWKTRFSALEELKKKDYLYQGFQYFEIVFYERDNKFIFKINLLYNW